MILEMNISMEAPNITMPRNSNSKDAIEVDLGSLHLQNAVAWRNGSSIKSPEVSVQHKGTRIHNKTRQWQHMIVCLLT